MSSQNNLDMLRGIWDKGLFFVVNLFVELSASSLSRNKWFYKHILIDICFHKTNELTLNIYRLYGLWIVQILMFK